MFFLASKILWGLIVPLNLCVLTLMAGVACLAGFRSRMGRRTGWSLVGFSLSILILFGVFPFGQNALVLLERQYPPLTAPLPHVDGIVLLGGAIETALPRPNGLPQMNDNGDRITEFSRLARLYPQARLVFTGGSADVAQKGPKEADLLSPLLTLLGIAPERMIWENESRNTYENALMTKALVHPGPNETWILVTSAFHMPRSVAIFESADWPVIPAPADYKTDGVLHVIPTRLDIAGNLSDFSTALHETIGFAAYVASGKIVLAKSSLYRKVPGKE